MNLNKKAQLLEKLIDKSKEVVIEYYNDPVFKIWKNSVERALIKIYGDGSFELKEFCKLKFYYDTLFWSLDREYTLENLNAFRQDFETALQLIRSYAEDLKEELQEVEQEINIMQTQRNITKIFISHASKDASIVEEVVDLIETIGLKSHQIFCSSFEGYGINLGENFLERLKEELNEDVLVIFMLSHNFYDSPICLCEMGATWIKTQAHIPILLPPFDYKDVKGVIPLTQGFKIDEPLRLNLLKERLEKEFQINPLDHSIWERKRDRALKRIEEKLKNKGISPMQQV